MGDSTKQQYCINVFNTTRCVSEGQITAAQDLNKPLYSDTIDKLAAFKEFGRCKMVAMNPKLIKEAICLWIDGIGGYAMCSTEAFRFGSAASSSADASVFADIPASAFSIATVQESTILTPEVNGISVNGRNVERPCILKHLDRIEVLGRVGLLYRRPNPLSQTAVLTLLTRHRWNHHVDGVVLMSHCCVIGGTTKAHIFNPHSDAEWLLTRESDQWFIGGKGPMESQRGQVKQLLTPMRRFKGDGIQLTLAVERIEY